MHRAERSRLTFGILLILVGALFLAARFFPVLTSWIQINISWPLIVIAAGAVLLVFGLLAGAPDMAVPACIVAGIGGILYWQNLTGRWESWEYIWALIPGFVGVGILLSAVLGGSRKGLSGGVWLIFISLVLFAIFGSFFGGLGAFGPYWPVLLIVLGIAVLVRGVTRRRAD
jgi:hypothetical protein